MSKLLDPIKAPNGIPKSPDLTSPLQNQKNISGITSVTAFQGPIPPPQFLEHYESLVPGSAKRFLEQPHLEAMHRRLIENAMINAQIESTKRGQWMAFFLAVVCIFGAFSAIFCGYELAGLATLFVSIGSLVGVFAYAKHQNK